MRMPLLFVGALLLPLAWVSPAISVDSWHDPIFIERAILPDEVPDEGLGAPSDPGLRADTTWYGDYQIISGQYYARSAPDKASIMWTFDRGNGPVSPPAPLIPNGEGWSAYDITSNSATYFRVIDNTINLGQGVPSPIISGTRSLWVGATKTEADALCWPCGAGYGNGWCQRVTSEPMNYSGAGDVTLNFKYYSQAEPCYDGTQVYLRRADSTELMLNPYPAGTCTNNTGYTGGTFTDSIGSFFTPEIYNRVITAAEIGGPQTVSLIIEFSSDGGWSDEDCDYATIWGPFAADDMTVTGGGINKSYNFETGLQGWSTGVCSPVGTFVDIVDVSPYTILDPCQCRLEGNIMELHSGIGDAGVHPVGQHVQVKSPICWFGNSDLKTIFMEFDMYAELPQENGVLIRPGWNYYPYVCEVTGVVGWSSRIGQSAYNYFGSDPVCSTWRYGGTTIASGTPIPADAQGVIAIIELMGDCESFAIDPCSGVTNATPLFDNLAVGVTAGRRAPLISFENGTRYQDTGSFPSGLFDPRGVGPANVTRDLNMDTAPGTARDKCGDSLVVAGPIPGSDPNTRWDAKMWWRVARRGPFQDDYENGTATRYKIWKDRVADGRLIDRPVNPAFTWGWMDSVQVGFVVTRNKFLSEFREDDDDFVGEGNPENEMIWDDVLRPGTRIEYFITSNYRNTPSQYYYYPDTTGRNFFEFEVLPGVRTARVSNCGGTGFNYCVYQPSTLYIDAYNGGAQFYVENALRTVLNGMNPCVVEDGCEIPVDRNWDRYDYLDSSSNWNAPFVRGSVSGSNNGMTLNQILGYRAIMVNTGTFGGGGMQDEDFRLFDDWLVSPDCGANTNRQVFLMNGDKSAELLALPGGQNIDGHGLAMLNNTLGATLVCDAFNGFSQDPDCTPENTSYCVRWLAVGGGSFPAETDVDAYGNYCPNLYGYNVLSLNGGVGNRYYSAEDGLKNATYGQITMSNLGASANYRTVLDGVSWHHMTRRNAGGGGLDRCPRDTPSIVDASLSEIGAALKWGFGVANYSLIPKLQNSENLALCQGTWNFPSDVYDGESSQLVNRLYQNEPNPFNPKTTIRFSLGQAGQVKIIIFDVGGRLVKTLVAGEMQAGLHSVVWDGRNDEGKIVGSGVYWSQMSAEGYVSNKKMVIMK